MKKIHYHNMDGTIREVEYDEMHPCLSCGEPVHNASMGGTVICPSCDLGRCRFCGISVFVMKKEIDNGSSYNQIREHMKWHRELLGLPERYTEIELHEALLKQRLNLHGLKKSKLGLVGK